MEVVFGPSRALSSRQLTFPSVLPVNSHLLKFVSLCNDLRINLLSNHADDT